MLRLCEQTSMTYWTLACERQQRDNRGILDTSTLVELGRIADVKLLRPSL